MGKLIETILVEVYSDNNNYTNDSVLNNFATIDVAAREHARKIMLYIVCTHSIVK